MTDEGFKRKLTAILSADVKGYSRLMGEDEAATVQIQRNRGVQMVRATLFWFDFVVHRRDPSIESLQ